MANKDIDLVIRARNKATGAIDEISKSLKELNSDQGDLAKSADKTSGALGGLAADVQKLQRETDRLKALGTIAAEMDKASAAVTRMQTNVRETAGDFARLARESDQATQAAVRLKAQLSAEEAALSENKAALREKKTELTAVNKLVRDAEVAQKRYNDALAKAPSARRSRGVGADIGAPQTSASASAGTFVASALDAARTQQARVVAEVRKYEQAVEGATVAIRDLRPQVSAANSLQNSLAAETEKASGALVRQRDSLGKARTELATIQTVSSQAGSALGQVAVTQDQVAAASQRMAANLAAAKARLEGLGTVRATNAAATNVGGLDQTAINAQRRAMLEARKEFVAAEAEVKRLAQAFKAADAPTEEMGAALGRAQAAARIAKTAYQELQTAVARAANGAKSNFSAWERGSATLRGAAAATTAANQQIAGSAAGAATAQGRVAPAIRATGAAASAAAGQTRLFSGSLLDLQNNTRQSLSLMQRLRGELLALAAGYVGLQAAISNIGGAINAYRTLEAAQSRLGVVFNQDTGRVAQEIDFLRAQADRLGIAFGTLADEYGKFAVAADASNFTTEETRKVFLSIAEAGRVAKLSNEQLKGTFLALTQMMSKGRVTAEELRGQLGERLTGAYKIFADALGVTTAELTKMMEQGEVVADRQTFLKFADEMTRRFGPQLSAALQTVSTDIGRFEYDIEQAQLTIANGLVPGLQQALRSFNEFSKSAEGQALFTNLGDAIGKFLVLLAEVPKYFDLISISVQAFIALQVARTLGGIIGRMVETSRATAAFSRELTLIGPRTQAAAASQGFLAAGMGQVVSTLATYRQNLLATAAASGTTRVSTLALAGAVGFLRTGLIAATGIARTFLAAFGGPIGLAITAITFAATQWMTSVDGATAAIAEHDRQVRALQGAYQEAGTGVDDWATKVNGVTIAQALANTEAIRQSYADATASIEAYSRQAIAWFREIIDAAPDDLRAVQAVELNDLAKQFREGVIGIDAFTEALNNIALNAADEDLKSLALGMLDLLNKSDDSRRSLIDLAKTLELSEAKLRLMSGVATEADKVLLGLKKGVEETNATFDKSSFVDKYTAAIDTLKSKIPGLTDELKRLKEMTEINTTAWNGMVAAFQAGDYGKIGHIISLWAQAAGAVTQAQNDQMVSSFSGSNKDVIERIIYVEGGQNGGGPSTSSARGIGQFTEGTWLRLFDRIYPELASLNETQKLALRTSDEHAKRLLQALTEENQAALLRAGAPVDAGSTYLAHFLGAGDAIKVLLANPDELAENIVQKSSVAANPSVFKAGVTAGDLIGWANGKMGGGSPIQSGGMTQAENQTQETKDRIAALDQQIKQQDLINAGKAREAEIEKAIGEARKENPAITEEELALIRAKTGELYDQKAAGDAMLSQQEQARELLNQITGLDQQRKVLLEEIKMAQDNGETAQAATLIEQLTGINGQLDQLIPKAMEFARALGDERMVATLQKVQLNAAKATQQFSFLGLSMKQWQGLGNSFADGLVGAIDSFAQAIANGENAVDALKTAFLRFAADFLRQIAMMILKQMVLNALQSIFPGMGFGMAHTGGLVGGAGTGSGNGSRHVAPAFFANAMRYHTGGIAGLKPDEVPTILKKNEEVLTESDERHRFNYDPTSGESKQPRSIKQVLVLDPSDLANAMSSKPGEDVIITTIKRNASTIRQLLG